MEPNKIEQIVKAWLAARPPRQYAPGWSKERAEKQRQRCLDKKPWLKSTGAKTDIGKFIASQNSCKHRLYSKYFY